MLDDKPYRPARDLVPIVPSGPEPRDAISEHGANRVARELDAWWHARGFSQVQHWVVIANAKTGHLWCVRTNLVNGLPPRAPA
jgi:hypothetical protein